jgi:hypothetical protein
MSIKRFFIVLALVIVLGMACVWQHSQSIRAGYEINKLSFERHELLEAKRAADYALVKMKDPQCIKDRIAGMELNLALPGETTPLVGIASNGDRFSSGTP